VVTNNKMWWALVLPPLGQNALHNVSNVGYLVDDYGYL